MPTIDRWGPAAWDFLHTVSFHFPEQPTPRDRREYKAFFQSLGAVLPCEKCRAHYVEYTNNHPIDLTGRGALARWLVGVHNAVNRRHGKREYSFVEAQALYSDDAMMVCDPTGRHRVLLLIAAVVIVFLVAKNK